MLNKMKYISKLYSKDRLMLKKKSLLNFIKDESGIIGYLNPYTFNILDLEKIYRNMNFKFVFETITSTFFFSKILDRKVDALNIDFTGVAADVFEEFERTKTPVVFIGGTEEDIQKFKVKISNLYPDLLVKAIYNGYTLDHNKISNCSESERIAYIVGLGSPLQESFSQDLYNACLIKPIIIVSGGFISQFAGSDNKFYYPSIFKFPILRAVYRMFKVRRILKRTLKYYPFTIAIWLLYSLKILKI